MRAPSFAIEGICYAKVLQLARGSSTYTGGLPLNYSVMTLCCGYGLRVQLGYAYSHLMQLATLKQDLSHDLLEVDNLIVASLHSDVALIQDIAHYIIRSGGKRLRPLLVLLSAKACAYVGQQQLTMAAVLEFIHTATLLHDDVVDNAMLRRNHKTANNQWGNQAAILVGDFLYSRAFQLMVQANDLQIMRIVANATNTIAEGEVLQLMYQKNPATSEADYLRVIRCKTAKLFEAAAEIGAVLGKQPMQVQTALARYGMHLGTAYQLIDDLLDYQADTATLGKNIGNDLAEGKPTLPLIHVLRNGTMAQRALIKNAILNPSTANFAEIYQAVQQTKSLEYTREFADREATLARQALAEVADTINTQDLLNLVDHLLLRNN